MSAFLRAFFNKENCAAVRNSLLMLFHKPHPKIKQQVFASENFADSDSSLMKVADFNGKKKKKTFKLYLLIKILFLLI